MSSTAHPAVGSDWREFTDRDAREDQIGTDLSIDLAADLAADLAVPGAEPGF